MYVLCILIPVGRVGDLPGRDTDECWRPSRAKVDEHVLNDVAART